MWWALSSLILKFRVDGFLSLISHYKKGQRVNFVPSALLESMTARRITRESRKTQIKCENLISCFIFDSFCAFIKFTQFPAMSSRMRSIIWFHSTFIASAHTTSNWIPFSLYHLSRRWAVSAVKIMLYGSLFTCHDSPGRRRWKIDKFQIHFDMMCGAAPCVSLRLFATDRYWWARWENLRENWREIPRWAFTRILSLELFFHLYAMWQLTTRSDADNLSYTKATSKSQQ